jgi:septal ring factor EnvC (AmiA/AmiB activator)
MGSAGTNNRVRMIAVVLGALLLIVLLVGGLFIKHQQDVARAEQQRFAQEIAEQRAAADRLITELKEQRDAIKSLTDAMDKPKDAANKAATGRGGVLTAPGLGDYDRPAKLREPRKGGSETHLAP